jgi:hypothetical protein
LKKTGKREEASLSTEEMTSHLEDKTLSLKVNDTIFKLYSLNRNLILITVF